MILRKHTVARPDGTIIVTSDQGTVEADMVQCVHCGRQWTVQPGSGRKTGYCKFHQGRLCSNPQCAECLGLDPGMQHGAVADAAYAKVRRREQLEALHTMRTKGGIIIP
jgi:hypothetical protein